jgi:excisionase family DNA binding protein
MATCKPKTIPDHKLLTIGSIIEPDGFHFTPAEILRRLTGPAPRAASDPAGCSCKPKAPPGMLTTQQVAVLLSCSRRTVERMANDGALTRRFLRPGNTKSLRFSEAEVSAFCAGGPAADTREG